jgi:hypothetical protein
VFDFIIKNINNDKMDLDNLDMTGGATSGFSNLTIGLIALALCALGFFAYKMYFTNSSKCDDYDLCPTENKAPENVNHCEGDKCFI